jgi:hypothetical protein
MHWMEDGYIGGLQPIFRRNRSLDAPGTDLVCYSSQKAIIILRSGGRFYASVRYSPIPNCEMSDSI